MNNICDQITLDILYKYCKRGALNIHLQIKPSLIGTFK